MIPGLYFSQIDLGFVTFQVWGLMASIGFLVALLISLKEARGKNIDSEIIWNLMIMALLGMIIGSKFFYLFSGYISSGDMEFSFDSGFSFVGGALLAGILVFFYLKSLGQGWRKISDLLVVGFIVSLICTRIGCLLISDHIGRITDLPWGMQYIDGTIRHPVVLYHILSLFVILFLILKVKAKKMPEGFLFFYFCALYAFLRFIADFFRCDDLPVCDAHFWGLTATQWILIPVFVFSLSEVGTIRKLFKRDFRVIIGKD